MRAQRKGYGLASDMRITLPLDISRLLTTGRPAGGAAPSGPCWAGCLVDSAYGRLDGGPTQTHTFTGFVFG